MILSSEKVEQIATYIEKQDELTGMDSLESDRIRTAIIEGAKAQAKKTLDWGNSICPHGCLHGYAYRRECTICWQELREELE